MNPPAAPQGVDKADTTTIVTSGIERPSITPAQFIAELEAKGVTVPEGADKPADATPDKPTADKPGGDAAKPAETAEAKTEGGEKPAVDPNGDTPDKPAETVEAKAEDPAAGDATKPESADVKAARKIYAAAARKEAAALKATQTAKTLQSQIDHVVKLRDEDPVELLRFIGFGQGAERDPVKDMLSRVVAKGEKPTPTTDERVAALERQLETERTAAAKQSEEAVITAAKARITEQVKAAGERFDLVNAFEAHEDVTNVMEEYYRVHGTPLDPMRAAEQVEKHLTAKVGRSNKFKAPGPDAKAAKPGTSSNGKPPASDAKGKSETLTNTGSGGASSADEELPFDDHDARAKAAAKRLGLAFSRN